MKRISILVIAIALLAITLPVMAQVTINGEIKNGFSLWQDPVTEAGMVGVSNSGNVKFTAQADENVTGTVQINFPTLALDKAQADIKLLEALGVQGLPVSILLSTGFFEAGNKDAGKVDSYELSDAINLKNKDWIMSLDTTIMNMVTVRLAFDPDYSATVSNMDILPILVGAFGTFGPVSAELFYSNFVTDGGSIGIGASFAQDIITDLNLKVGADTQIDLLDPDAKISWGAGVAVAYKSLVKATVGINGNVTGDVTDQAVETLGFNVESTPIELITVGAGTRIVLWDSGFDGSLGKVEGMVQFNLGKATLSTGLFFVPADAPASIDGKGDLYAWNAPASIADDSQVGFFLQSKISW